MQPASSTATEAVAAVATTAVTHAATAATDATAIAYIADATDVAPRRLQPSRLSRGEERRAALAAEFDAFRVVRRQMAVFDAECGCTKRIFQRQASLHRSLERVTVLDGSHFRWEGLGNSGVRWMGLMRWGLSTGRATFLRLTQDCAAASRREEHAATSGRPSDRTCHLDPGDYVTGWGGVDWRWGTATERRVTQQMAARGAHELLLEYECVKHVAPGCGVAALRFPNGSKLELREPDQMLAFFRTAAHPFIRLKLHQQDSLEHSYSKPEALRTTLPLTACPVAGGPAFSARELCLKCETFALMQPRPRLMRALLPALRKLEPYDVLVGVHLRTGYADWQFRNSEQSFRAASADELPVAPQPERRVREHWQRLDSFLRDCKQVALGPCFNWESPGRGRAPAADDALACRIGRHKPSFELSADEAPRGALSSLLTCAARLGESLVMDNAKKAATAPAAATASAAAASASAAPSPPMRWGLLVLSDSPAFPSLAAHLPALQRHRGGGVVTSHGLGRIGHSSFTKSCSGVAGKCDYGRDPGGTWTRSMVDFYLAGVVDAFAKALFTSFIWATMRRNLLCCRPGAFVQWMAWYNLTRSHRDRPMLDHAFMHALEQTHEADEGPDAEAAGRAMEEESEVDDNHGTACWLRRSACSHCLREKVLEEDTRTLTA